MWKLLDKLNEEKWVMTIKDIKEFLSSNLKQNEIELFKDIVVIVQICVKLDIGKDSLKVFDQIEQLWWLDKIIELFNSLKKTN